MQPTKIQYAPGYRDNYGFDPFVAGLNDLASSGYGGGDLYSMLQEREQQQAYEQAQEMEKIMALLKIGQDLVDQGTANGNLEQVAYGQQLVDSTTAQLMSGYGLELPPTSQGMSPEDQTVQKMLLNQYGSGSLGEDATVDDARQAAAIEQYLQTGGTLESGYDFGYDPATGRLDKSYRPGYFESRNAINPFASGSVGIQNLGRIFSNDNLSIFDKLFSPAKSLQEINRVPLNY